MISFESASPVRARRVIVDMLESVRGRNWYHAEEVGGKTFRWSGPGYYSDVELSVPSSATVLVIELPTHGPKYVSDNLSIFLDFRPVAFTVMERAGDVELHIPLTNGIVGARRAFLLQFMVRHLIPGDSGRLLGFPVSSICVQLGMRDEHDSENDKALNQEGFPFWQKLGSAIEPCDRVWDPGQLQIHRAEQGSVRNYSLEIQAYSGAHVEIYRYAIELTTAAKAMQISTSVVNDRGEAISAHTVELTPASPTSFRVISGTGTQVGLYIEAIWALLFLMQTLRAHIGTLSSADDTHAFFLYMWIGRAIAQARPLEPRDVIASSFGLSAASLEDENST